MRSRTGVRDDGAGMDPDRACAELDSVSGTWFRMTTEGFQRNSMGAGAARIPT